MNRKICLVANFDWVIYNFRLPLVNYLQDRGLEITLICPPGEYTDRMVDAGYRWIPWRLDRRSTAPWRETSSIQNLVKLYQQESPDVVHHITIKPILYGSIAARMAGIPLVINNFTGLGFLFSDSFSATWLRRLTMPVLRWALPGHGFQTVLLNNHDQKRLQDYKLIAPDSTNIIPGDGVDSNRFYPASHPGDGTSRQTVIMAARLLWDKGVSEFIEAAQLLNNQDFPVDFWLAGKPDPGNPSCIPDAILDQWQRAGVVEFLGQRKDMPDLLRQASIAVLPSYHEGLPMFLLEAASTGLPLVASDIAGCRMIVKHQENGLLVPIKDSKALAKAILNLLKNPERQSQMGNNSRLLVEKKFSQKQILDQFGQLYEKIGVL